MRQSDIAIEKYCLTQSGHFRFSNTVALGIGITDGKLLFCHCISHQIKDKAISMREYNNSTVYDCFENTFPVDCGSPVLNLHPISIDDIPHPNIRSWYTYDSLPSDISANYGKSISKFTTPSHPPQLIEPNYEDTDTLYTIISDNPFPGRIRNGYSSRSHDGKICNKNQGYIAPHDQWIRVFITVMDQP